MTSSPLGTTGLDLAPPKAWRRLVPLMVRSLIWVDAVDRYDAFLSYSWKADKVIAPLVQSVIQRFLCPWYKVRAKTVFRDLSCLPAGSSLEAQLFERLDRSEHLLVLASPEAVNSHGMEMEAQHWFSRVRTGQVLIIVTSGDEQTWEEIRNHLLPPAISANLTTEPLWIPLQHRRADFVANPNSHELSGRLVEDLRQVLLCFYPGRDWGQLRGEERSQRRRALGLMTGLTLLFLVLAVAAVGFAAYAQRQRLLAQSRQMAAQSASLKVQSPALLTRSILLAAESLRINPNLEADQTIRTGVPLLGKPAFRIPYQANLSRIVLSPTGELLATVGYLETHADVWRIADRQRVASLPHDVAIEDVAFDPTGTILAIAGLDGKVVVLWNLPTMKEARLDCGSAVNVLAFSHDGRYLATGQHDHTVRIWRVSLEPKVSFRQVAVLKHDDEVFGVTFSRDDRYLATSYLNFAVLWKLKHQSNDLSTTFLGYVEAEAAVNSIAISPDDKYLATGICCGRPFRLWDVEQRALVTIMPDEGAESVGFSPDGKYVTAASRDDTAGVWKITQGESGSVDVEEVSRVQARSGSIVFTSDGKHLVTHTGAAIVFWERNADSITASFPTDSFAKFASSPNGRRMVVANDPFQPVQSFDLDTGTSQVLLKLDKTERSLALSRDATHLATQRDDGAVLVRKLASPPVVVATLPPDPPAEPNNKDRQDVRSTQFSPDAHSLVLRKNNGTLVFWDLLHDKPIRSSIPGDPVYAIRLSEDGKYLITASGAIRGHRAAAEKHIVRIWDVATGQPTARIEISWSQEAKKRELATAISPDGRYFATARETLAQVWDSSTGRELFHVVHEKSIHSVAFSSDSKLLGTASDDGTAKVWKIGNGKEVVRLAHEGAVWEIAFSPDGKHVATASDDRSARVWEYLAGREIARAVHKEMARGVFFSADGTRVISWSPTSGELKSWIGRAEDLVDAACKGLMRNLTADESREYLLDARRKTCPNLP